MLMTFIRSMVAHCLIGASLTVLSTFVGERSATAFYPDIMGCEAGCTVTATGWPLIFVTDYLGMSVANTADIMEVWFAADRFAWTPFLFDAAFWTAISLITTRFGKHCWGRMISKSA